MHESGIVEDLIGRLEKLSHANGGGRVRRVGLGLGVDAGFSRAHFEEHFRAASAATIAEGAELAIHSREGDALTLETLEVEET
jgi:Zn finger protein HypA/HybF involved in hydrogenase expression